MEKICGFPLLWKNIRIISQPSPASEQVGAGSRSPQRNEKTLLTLYQANPDHRCARRHGGGVSRIPAFVPEQSPFVGVRSSGTLALTCDHA
jgi:hypothetical protein